MLYLNINLNIKNNIVNIINTLNMSTSRKKKKNKNKTKWCTSMIVKVPDSLGLGLFVTNFFKIFHFSSRVPHFLAPQPPPPKKRFLNFKFIKVAPHGLSFIDQTCEVCPPFFLKLCICFLPHILKKKKF